MGGGNRNSVGLSFAVIEKGFGKGAKLHRHWNLLDGVAVAATYFRSREAALTGINNGSRVPQRRGGSQML